MGTHSYVSQHRISCAEGTCRKQEEPPFTIGVKTANCPGPFSVQISREEENCGLNSDLAVESERGRRFLESKESRRITSAAVLVERSFVHDAKLSSSTLGCAVCIV